MLFKLTAVLTLAVYADTPMVWPGPTEAVDASSQRLALEFLNGLPQGGLIAAVDGGTSQPSNWSYPFQLVVADVVGGPECGASLSCWKRRTDKLMIGLSGAAEALSAHEQEFLATQGMVGVLTSEVGVLKGLGQQLQALVPAAEQTPWWKSALFWAGIGLIAGIAAGVSVTIGLYGALKGTTK